MSSRTPAAEAEPGKIPSLPPHGVTTVLQGAGLDYRSTIPRVSGYDSSAFSPDEVWGSTDRHGVSSHTYTIDWPQLIAPTKVTFTLYAYSTAGGLKTVQRTAWKVVDGVFGSRQMVPAAEF